MARYISPVASIQDVNGDPIVGAKLFFFETGTTTPKTIYEDSGLTTPLNNPVLSDANGQYTDNIFLDGVYKNVQQDNSGTETGFDGATIWIKDPIGDIIEGQFELWLNDNTYNIPEIVLGSDDEYYRSIVDGNQGNDPTTSPTKWEQLQLGRVWNTNVTYTTGDSAYGSDGFLYVSRTSSNSGNNPTTDNLNWEKIGRNPDITSITGTVAANAITAGLNPIILEFRSSTLTDGLAVTRNIGSVLSLVVPSGATLGTINAIQNRLVLLAIDNAGTVELAIVNQSGGNNLDETTLISTTAIDATADSNNVIYSETARTNVPFRVVGYIESTQATAGTWATAPSTLQGMGGNALTAMSSLGYSQTWQNVTGSRALATTYYNTTGKPIEARVIIAGSVQGILRLDPSINGVSIGQSSGYTEAAGYQHDAQFIIPPNASYSVSITGSSGTPTLSVWQELR